MKRSRCVRRTLFSCVFALSMPLALVGCPKKPPPQQEIAPPPPPASTPSVTELAPLGDDAGNDADAAEAGRKWSGGGGGGGQNAKVLACCAAMRSQAKKLGTSPEANQLIQLASTCEQAAKGNAPEFAWVLAAIRSKNVPGCQGL